MLIVGCDYHPSFQQIAWVETDSGEVGERALLDSTGEAEKFYRKLKDEGVKVRVGIEATVTHAGLSDCWRSWDSNSGLVMRQRSGPSVYASKRTTGKTRGFCARC